MAIQQQCNSGNLRTQTTVNCGHVTLKVIYHFDINALYIKKLYLCCIARRF